MTPIQVVGIGLNGADGLSPQLLELIDQAAILAGSDRHLDYFSHHAGQRWSLKGLEEQLQQHLQRPHPERVVVLTSGDPLFFGLGRRLLQTLPADALTFHPHISSIQLAFNRVKLPWQEATLVSVHGRSLERLEQALKKHQSPIAVLTDHHHTPGVIAQLIQSLALPIRYQLWLCENLGGENERVQQLSLTAAQGVIASPLNVVILQRLESPSPLRELPILGIPDQAFLSFRDRPGLMTKREVRVQILAELALRPQQVVWDIGAGTGSVSVEIGRLVPDAQVWAIEKSTAGYELIRQNADRFGVENITAIQGIAPEVLSQLPDPHRILIGGSSGRLLDILAVCTARLRPTGRLTVALATLENLAEVNQWLTHHTDWQGSYQQISLARSVAIGSRQRWSPLNPVTLVSLIRRD